MVGAAGGDPVVRPRSRRAVLTAGAAGLAGASVGVLGGCGGDRQRATRQDTGQEQGATGSADVDILNRALDVENVLVAAYRASVRVLGPRTRELGRLILEQEREHADGLAQTIRQLGGTPHRPKPASAYPFPRLRTQGDALRLVHRLENQSIAGYRQALPTLSEGKLRQTAAAILTTEAEHVTLLLQWLGERPGLPGALVTGRRRRA